VIGELRKRLRELANPVRAAVSRRYFKTGPGQYAEGDRFFGLAVPQMRGLAKEFQSMALDEVTTALRLPWHEERLVALLILVRQFTRGDDRLRKTIYQLYLANTALINNWDLVDTTAEHIVGAFLVHRSRAPLRKLARSPIVWERRIAILATFHYIKRGEVDETLQVAATLLGDSHDLIHKAVGWMLREVGKRNPASEREFLDRYAATMPRTMLRYAVERFPEPLRRQYLDMRKPLIASALRASSSDD
jgi:3-methyladenine DNA glycosylase AlkD